MSWHIYVSGMHVLPFWSYQRTHVLWRGCLMLRSISGSGIWSAIEHGPVNTCRGPSCRQRDLAKRRGKWTKCMLHALPESAETASLASCAGSGIVLGCRHAPLWWNRLSGKLTKTEMYHDTVTDTRRDSSRSVPGNVGSSRARTRRHVCYR